MAATPVYLGTAMTGTASLTTGNLNTDGATGAYVSVTWDIAGTAATTAPTADWQLNKVLVLADGNVAADLADSVVRLFVVPSSGSAYLLTDIDIGNPAALSGTTTGVAAEVAYSDYKFAKNSTLKAAITVTPTTGTCRIVLFGEMA